MCDIDIDLAVGAAVISRQLQYYGRHLTLCPHHSQQQADRARLADRCHDSGYVITRLNGDPFGPDRLSHYFRQLSAAAGLPPIRLHDLRRGAASLALSARTYTSVLPEVAR